MRVMLSSKPTKQSRQDSEQAGENTSCNRVPSIKGGDSRDNSHAEMRSYET